MKSINITAVIPAFNEETRIGSVIEKTKKYVDEILVIDDCSFDKTKKVAERSGAIVITNNRNLGYIESLKKGFKNAQGDIIVTLDADGEHAPEEIPKLIKQILVNKADLVLGKREKISRISEHFLNWLTSLKIKINDSGTGFRAIKKKLALKLDLRGKCTCGIFILEANYYGAKIVEVPIVIRSINKKRKIAWHHFIQFFYLLRWIIAFKS